MNHQEPTKSQLLPTPSTSQEIIILHATPGMRDGPGSPLIQLVREFEPYWRVKNPKPIICALEVSFRTILRSGLLLNYPDFYCLPLTAKGGLVYATDIVISYSLGTEDVENLEKKDPYPVRVFCLIDPGDPTSVYPETLALKRECVVAGKTFLATHYGAAEWTAIQWYAESGMTSLTGQSFSSRRLLTPGEIANLQKRILRSKPKPNITLVAHDEKKKDMLDFALKHFDYLFSEYGERYATGTTGTLLNGDPPKRKLGDTDLEDRRQKIERLLKQRKVYPWVIPQTSGPRGGDVQIARKILDRECQKIIFFEDPHVSREHEADIQLLERAARIPNLRVLCVHDKRSAEDWAANWRRCIDHGISNPMTLVEAYRRIFNVELVLAEPGRGSSISPQVVTAPQGPSILREAAGLKEPVWRDILRTAAYYFLGLVSAHARARRLQSDRATIGVTWGFGIHELIKELIAIKEELQLADEQVERWLASAYHHRKDVLEEQGEWPPNLTEKLTHPRFLKPDDVVVVPVIGIMGSTDPRVEANQNARFLVDRIGGEATALPQYAFVERDTIETTVSPLQSYWDKLDILVFTCDLVKPRFGGKAFAEMPSNLYNHVKEAAGEMGGLFLTSEGAESEYGEYWRNGISHDTVQATAKRKGSILIAGAQGRRSRAVIAALKGRLVSALVTDPQFAWKVLYEYIGLDVPDEAEPP